MATGTETIHLGLAEPWAIANLRAAIARALGDDCPPHLDWSRDAENVDGWVAEWIGERDDDRHVAAYLEAHYDVRATVSYDDARSWIWVAPRGK